jgi:hypothetical protein
LHTPQGHGDGDVDRERANVFLGTGRIDIDGIVKA